MPQTPGSSLAPDLFAERRIVVTGGTSGIGAAIARRFVELGGDVVAAGLPAPGGDTPDGVGRVVDLDVHDADAVAALFDSLPTLDVLVACAGTIRRDGEYDPEVFADVLDVNLTGTFRTAVAARPLLARSRGCVVTTASMLAFVGGPHAPAYSASKGGVAALTRSLAVAWADSGVRVNAIAPGWIATPLTAPVRADEVANDRIVSRTPMRRWGEPSEVAELACFLAGPGAGFITGATIPVDGGYLAA